MNPRQYITPNSRNSRTLSVLLAVLICIHPMLATVRAQDEVSRKDIILINERLNQIQIMLMPEDAKKHFEEQATQEIEKAKKRILNPLEGIESELGNQLRGVLKTQIGQIVDIDATTSKADVEQAIGAIQTGKNEIMKIRKQAIEVYHLALAGLSDTVRIAVLGRPLVSIDWLEQLGKDKLIEIIKFLDASLLEDTEEARSKQKELVDSSSAGQIAERIFREFTRNGVMTGELIAALGNELVQKVLTDNGIALTDVDKKAIEQVENAAKQAADVHRAGADFADFSVNLLNAAMMTGNPYVIAAAAAIILLIALFKFVFGKGGGGGGGDGDGGGESDGSTSSDAPGSGEGAGSAGRNTGSDEAGRQTQGTLVATNDNVAVDGEGKLAQHERSGKPIGGSKDGLWEVTVDGNTLNFYLKAETAPQFSVAVPSIAGATFTASSITAIPEVASDKSGFNVLEGADKPLQVRLVADTWRQIETSVVVPPDEKKPFWTKDAKTQIVTAFDEDGKQVASVNLADVKYRTGATKLSIDDLKVFGTATATTIDFEYGLPNGQTANGRFKLVDGDWRASDREQ